MQITLHISFDSLDEYNNYQSGRGTAPAPTPAKATPAGKKAAAEPAPTPAAPLVAAATPEKVQALRDKLKALLSAQGKDAIVEVLKTFSAEKISDIAPDKLDAVIAAIDAKLATAKPAAAATADNLFD